MSITSLAAQQGLSHEHNITNSSARTQSSNDDAANVSNYRTSLTVLFDQLVSIEAHFSDSTLHHFLLMKVLQHGKEKLQTLITFTAKRWK